MNNESIKGVDPKHIWVRGTGSDVGAGADENPFQRGHPDEIDDIVSINAPVEVVEKLKSAKKLEEILGVVNLHEEKQQQQAREEVYKYEKLLGEQLQEDYIIEAARAAVIEMISVPKGETNDQLLAAKMFSSLFAEKIREKEQDPFNKRDTDGEATRVVETDD